MKTIRFIVYFSLIVVTIPLLVSCDEQKDEGIVVYKVTKSGADRSSADRLAKELGIGEDLRKDGSFVDSNGRISIIDPQKHLSVPIKPLGKEKNDEDNQLVTAEALDIEELKKVKPMDQKEAREVFLKALKISELLPDEGDLRIKHNQLRLIDEKGSVVMDTAINTRVDFNIRISEIPVEGPGAKVNASFSPEKSITRLKHSNRSLSKSEKVTLVNSNEARERCLDTFTRSTPDRKDRGIDVETRLFYYAPPLNLKGVHTIIPYYECKGTEKSGDQIISLLQQAIPAIDDKRYVPVVEFEATLIGREVHATAVIEGGSPPYQIQWSSPSIDVKEEDNKLTYTVARRNKEAQEVLILEVTDSNGVFVQTSQVIKFNQTAFAFSEPIEFPVLKMGGVYDYGTENSVYGEFGSLEQGFKDQMDADGVIRRFSWGGPAAWEQDFKEPEDSNWIDNTDITFYVGHGNVGFFTFEDSSHDDSILDNNDATGDWGDKDLEWLALYSCKVLGKGDDGQEPFRNWKQEFDGLHLLLGFSTLANVSNQFSGAFAGNMVDANMTVLQAWFDAIDDHQPNNREGVVMGVFRANDFAWNFNDHFHGKGSVGPDIRGSNIGLGWYVTGP